MRCYTKADLIEVGDALLLPNEYYIGLIRALRSKKERKMNETVNTVDAAEVAPFTITDVTIIDGNDRDGETSRQEIEGTIFVAEDPESQPVSYDA